MILCLAQSPGTHAYIARKEVVENLLQMCELKEKIVSKQQPSKQGEKEEDPMAVNALKYGNFPSPLIFLLLTNNTPLSLSLSLSLSLMHSLTSIYML